jgi:hypothetical protein
MARLSKEQLGDRGRFTFNQEEVEIEELGGSVVVRTPSVGQRDELSKHTPDDEKDWTLEHTATLFSLIVVDPEVTAEEALEFLGDWPGTALDRITKTFARLVGTKEELRDAAGDFHSGDDGSRAEVLSG